MLTRQRHRDIRRDILSPALEIREAARRSGEDMSSHGFLVQYLGKVAKRSV